VSLSVRNGEFRPLVETRMDDGDAPKAATPVLIETFFTHREQFHSAMITPQVSLVDPATRDRLAGLQRYFMAHGYPDPAGAMHRAIIAVGQTIRAQATIMGYANTFALIGVVLLVAVLAVAFLRKGATAGGAAH
jgi:DHA2 family multidrug resistance protein